MSTRPHAAHPGIDSPHVQPQRTLRVLVAEDNPTNVVLTGGLLKRWGHSFIAAGNGNEAVSAWEREPFDLILMDVQMPEVDGFEATALIRSRELRTGLRIPIIAMTARDTPTDRDHCLSSGMDAYLAKPLQARALARAIAEVCPACPPAPPVVSNDEPANRQSPPALLGRLGGSLNDLRHLVRVFRIEAEYSVREIRAGIALNDPCRVACAAHSLKGAVGIIDTGPAFLAARRLESAGRAEDLRDAPAAFAELVAQLARLDPWLDEVLEYPSP